MESVGQKLRDARRRTGLSLEEISRRTRISFKSLEAIEADDFESIPSRFFYKSFVWQIADMLGVSRNELQVAFEAAYHRLPEPLVPGQPGAPVPPKLSSLRPTPVKVSRWVYSAALFVVMLAACSAVFGYWQDNRVQAAPITTAAKAVAHASAAGVQPASLKTTPEVDPKVVDVQLSATDTAWISVSSDGKPVFSGLLNPNETKDLQAHERAQVKTGNAGGLEVRLNGHSIGVLGAKGQVRTVVFSRNGYQIEDPVSAPLAFANR